MQLKSEAVAAALQRDGFVVAPGPVPPQGLADLAGAYDKAMLEADPADRGESATNTRVSDFVNRGAAFDGLYVHPPLLEACRRIIARPFRLSSMLGRTLHANSPSQGLHVDFARDAEGWVMVGFILMIDAFRPENGATCFTPGSQGASVAPSTEPVPACGPAGSMIIYNGSVWHGAGPNRTAQPRRSIQGAFVRRTEKSGIDHAARVRPETLARLSPLAREVLGV